MAWRREGTCNRCGACCKSGDPFTGSPHAPCPIYREVDGVGACSDRTHPYYLAGCNVWPSKPEHIADYPTCSYFFVLVT